MRGVPIFTLCVLLTSAGLEAARARGDPPPRSAQVNYALHCQGCHLPDGSGMPGKVPDMRGQLGRYMRLPSGRAYIVQVPGSANARISDKEKADLLNWLVAEMGPVDDRFRPYTAQEVATLRQKWLTQPLVARTTLQARLAETKISATRSGSR
jgi:mono/diheme cytochrome c family protein